MRLIVKALLLCLPLNLILAQLSNIDPISYPANPGITAIASGDFTGDGHNDIAVATNPFSPDGFTIQILTYQNDTLVETQEIIYPPIQPGITTLISDDINSDGLDDLIFGADTIVGVFYQRSAGVFDTLEILAVSSKVSSLIQGFFNSDSLPDIAVAHHLDTVLTILYQIDLEVWSPTLLRTPHGGYCELEIGDLNNDGKTDVAMLGNRNLDSIRLYGYIQGVNGIKPNYKTLKPKDDQFENVSPYGMAIGDLTGDGKDDIAVSAGGKLSSSRVFIWKQKNGGGFNRHAFELPTYRNPQAIEIKDLNFDNKNDLVVLHGGWKRTTVYLGASSVSNIQEVKIGVPYASNFNRQGLSLSDLTKDGSTDIIMGYHDGKIVLIENPIDPPPPQASSIDSNLLEQILNPQTDTPSSNITYLTTYPNPTDLRTTVEIETTVEGILFLTLYDLTGKLYLMRKIQAPLGISHINLDLSSVPAGSYLLHAKLGNADPVLHKLTILK